MMLSSGENIMWVAKQMGHANIETVIKVYGKWIPDSSIATGYKPINDWAKHIQLNMTHGPNLAPQTVKNEFLEENLVKNQKVMALPQKRGHFNQI